MRRPFSLFFLGLVISSSFAVGQNLPELSFDPVTQDLPTIDIHYPPAIQELFIPVENVKMTGFLLQANGVGPHPTFIMMHGLPGNEKNLDLAQSMRRAGFNVLFFHYRGAWGSQGAYSFLNLHQDALAAEKYLLENATRLRVDQKRISFIGHSFGGYAALRAGSESKAITCVVALSAANPASIARSKRVDDSFDANIGQYVDQLVMLNQFSGKVAMHELKNNIDSMDTTTYGEKLKNKNIFMIVGKQDTVTPPALQVANHDAYTKTGGVNLTSVMIDGDHSFSYSRIALQRKVIEWASTHCQ